VTVTTPSGTSATSTKDQFTYGAGPPPGAIPSPLAGGWQLNGSAKLVPSGTPPNLQLTAALSNEAGTAFWPTGVPGVRRLHRWRKRWRRPHLHDRRRQRHEAHSPRRRREW
jgi:hypothetical protein